MEMMEAQAEADGDACWDTGIPGQTPHCQCLVRDKAGEATEGNFLYPSFQDSGETGLKISKQNAIW